MLRAKLKEEEHQVSDAMRETIAAFQREKAALLREVQAAKQRGKVLEEALGQRDTSIRHYQGKEEQQQVLLRGFESQLQATAEENHRLTSIHQSEVLRLTQQLQELRAEIQARSVLQPEPPPHNNEPPAVAEPPMRQPLERTTAPLDSAPARPARPGQLLEDLDPNPDPNPNPNPA